MSRFKRREPFGKAGLTVAVCALVMALVGGAYAAGGLTKSQEKQVTKIAKKYAGKPGATGPAGPAGTNGTNGSPGKAGTNGKEGPEGKEGSPWTAGGVLPKGKSEKGIWTVTPVEVLGGIQGVSALSFVIPLQSAPTVVYLKQGKEGTEHTAECPGTLADPKASAGFLCLYTESEFFTPTFQEAVPHTAGFTLSFEGTKAGFPVAGSWAVTAE